MAVGFLWHSPIKTTAGFSIKSELRRFRYPAPSCHLDQRERSQGNAGDLDEEEEFAHELTRICAKGNWQLVFSGFVDKNNCRFFD
ncbi:hypothetical protein [Chlorobium phaeobacteroides]|uniref:hypothetical protein n=1 Tax=Chlorobium phaeobacteroides TaxID=1096 RepID=UPI0012318CD4|nr:hypothetical protein [Chlorobium phaeobacteroides]